MDWLVNTTYLFGLPAQNWMLVVTAAFIVYLAVLALARRAV